MAEQQSVKKSGIKELLGRFSVGAMIGGGMGFFYWLCITSYSEGWTKTATEFSIAWILLFTIGCGFMAVKGKKLLWTFLDSLPPMP
jgi:hypothetical protein